MTKVEDAILLEYMDNSDIVNDKKQLLRSVWERFGWDDTLTLSENLDKVPMAWSIDRALRKLRTDGKIKLAKDVEAERYRQYKEQTEYYADQDEKEQLEMDF